MRSKLSGCSPRTIGGSFTSALAAIVLAAACQTASASGTVAGAARDADIDAVRNLIAAGSDVNAPEADGTSALLWAAYQSAPDLVSILLKAGADPNAANSFGVTPLLQASRYGDAAVIGLLLKGGADLAAATRDGETPLMAAARAGSVDSVKLLLEHGADPNARRGALGPDRAHVGHGRRASRRRRRAAESRGRSQHEGPGDRVEQAQHANRFSERRLHRAHVGRA